MRVEGTRECQRNLFFEGAKDQNLRLDIRQILGDEKQSCTQQKPIARDTNFQVPMGMHRENGGSFKAVGLNPEDGFKSGRDDT